MPGIHICEHLPELAKRMKDYAIIRGLTHTIADHGLGKKYLLTGNRPSQTLSYPEYGSVVSKMHPSARDLPTYVSIDESFVGPGYLGNEFSALTAGKPTFGIPYSVRASRLRTASLSIDTNPKEDSLMIWTRLLRASKNSMPGQGPDRFGAQAHDIISAPSTRKAFDLEQEKPRNPSGSANMNLARACCSPRASLRPACTLSPSACVPLSLISTPTPITFHDCENCYPLRQRVGWLVRPTQGTWPL